MQFRYYYFFKGRPTSQHQLKMEKSTLRLLGRLLVIEEELWNQISDYPHVEEWQNKYLLVRKIKKNLEEQKRGFLKSKIPYQEMAEVALEFVESENYRDLHKRVMGIVFERNCPT